MSLVITEFKRSECELEVHANGALSRKLTALEALDV
jgi:hypothetical protein